MNCSRCNGMVITEQVPAETIVLTVDKCLMCGMRREHNHVPVPYDMTNRGRIMGNRCLNCRKDRTPGMSQCESCRNYQQQYRKENPRSKGGSKRRAVGPVWI